MSPTRDAVQRKYSPQLRPEPENKYLNAEKRKLVIYYMRRKLNTILESEGGVIRSL